MKKIAVIQDLSGLGKCSLTAAIPVISAMGVQACPLPTAILSNQTGYDSYFCDDYTDKMNAFTKEWQKRDFHPDGIYTGFLASEAQIDEILKFIRVFKTEKTKVIVDPVMGDDGSIYKTYSGGLCEKMQKLVGCADVITPNLTEALTLVYGAEKMCLKFAALSRIHDIRLYEDSLEKIGRKLMNIYRLQTVVITGIDVPGEAKVANLVVSDASCEWITTPRHGGSYSGTGDLFTSVLSAGVVKGEKVSDCVRKAVYFLEPAIRKAVVDGTDRNDGVCFETYLYKLWEEVK